MRAGKLRRLVDIQRFVVIKNDFGEDIQQWDLFKQAWAHIEPLNGREFFAAQEHGENVNVRVRLRHVDGIDTKMQIVFRKQVYEIVSIIDPGLRERELVLMCRTVL